MALSFDELELHQPAFDDVWLPQSSTGPPPGPLLFWDDPPWHYLDPSQALPIAKAVAEHGVAVAGLSVQWRRDGSDDDWWQDAGPRIAIVNNERFGLDHSDLASSDWIDVRLGHRRAADGTPTWKVNELARLGVTIEAEHAIALGLPAECTEASELAHTLAWLRQISKPQTLMSLSATSAQIEKILDALPQIAGPRDASGDRVPVVDAVIVRGQSGPETPSSWWPMADRWMKKLRELCQPNDPGSQTADPDSGISLYVVPRETEPDDAVRLWLGGVGGVAIDAWCDPLIWDAATANRDAWTARLRNEVIPKIERVRGLARYQSR